MSAGHERRAGALVSLAHLQELEILPMCDRWLGLDAGQVDRNQPTAMARRAMTAVITRPLLSGADLYRRRRCPRRRHDAS
jgi:hypothetical protein